jgi:hypothetical protein
MGQMGAFLVWRQTPTGEGTPWMHSAESGVPSLGTATSSMTSLPHYQQEVPLRASTARLDSARVLETLWGVYFTSECELKMIFLLKSYRQHHMPHFSLHALHFRGCIYSHLKENLCPYATEFRVETDRQ